VRVRHPEWDFDEGDTGEDRPTKTYDYRATLGSEKYASQETAAGVFGGAGSPPDAPRPPTRPRRPMARPTNGGPPPPKPIVLPKPIDSPKPIPLTEHKPIRWTNKDDAEPPPPSGPGTYEGPRHGRSGPPGMYPPGEPRPVAPVPPGVQLPTVPPPGLAANGPPPPGMYPGMPPAGFERNGTQQMPPGLHHGAAGTPHLHPGAPGMPPPGFAPNGTQPMHPGRHPGAPGTPHLHPGPPGMPPNGTQPMPPGMPGTPPNGMPHRAPNGRPPVPHPGGSMLADQPMRSPAPPVTAIRVLPVPPDGFGQSMWFSGPRPNPPAAPPAPPPPPPLNLPAPPHLANMATPPHQPIPTMPAPGGLDTYKLKQWKAENPVVDEAPVISWLDED
jgi:hypothetical protein